ncbi:hypothetical protein BGX26_003992 [Mortierella sp. AD094]|nr:hypothetical protein BGX26_003992 [Mortierella sp. AD094]
MTGTTRKELQSEPEAVTAQWVANELVIDALIHYRKAAVKFPTICGSADAALALLVVMSLEDCVSPGVLTRAKNFQRSRRMQTQQERRQPKVEETRSKIYESDDSGEPELSRILTDVRTGAK